MSYPTGCRIYIDGKDCTYYIFGSETFNPSTTLNTFRDIDITPYLRRVPESAIGAGGKTFAGGQVSNLHTIVITAEDGNGRVESRVEIR